jgi:transcriptional regulator
VARKSAPGVHFHGKANNPRPWSVDDAPRPFLTGQLRAIVGVEVVISRIEAKAKLSQNRPGADIDGVIAGLRTRGDDRSAAAVAGAKPYRPGRPTARKIVGVSVVTCPAAGQRAYRTVR